MKAITQDRYGPPDVLRLAEVAVPAPAAGELLVRVRAASVNAADWHIMRGDPVLARLAAPNMTVFGGPAKPVRGQDFAGVVEALGAGVTDVRPGAEVFGSSGDREGTFAEYVCVPVDAVAPRPAGLSFEQAAALPLAGTTALAGLRDAGRVSAGQRVLINGASGGVGTFAVQIARALGAEVTAVCSTRNVNLVRSLGADHVVDYTQTDFTRRPGNHAGRYDVVFDLVGNHSLSALRRAVTPGGTVVLSGGGVSRGGSLVGPMGLMIRGLLVGRFVRQRVVVFEAPHGREHLIELSRLIGTGDLRPVIDRTFPLGEVPAAIRYLEQEHASSKVVITI